ncbi:MAG: UDP-2,3-diacylglucosamine diphosphatase [Tannerella sp.]|jgi:UDP-2,3-diacylglucosamine hydrolase|nr:UDP-2,3-diacylglucosamine diphosphatase [Tannerella sp.]
MNPSQKKIFFAADAHLGNRYLDEPLAAEKKLVRWLDHIKHDAQAIYFLGDMFDYWYEYKYVVPKGHVRFLGKLAELSDQGIEIHLLIGNHDIWMFDYLPKEIGAVIHQGPLTVDLLGKRFFLAHGDEVGEQRPGFRFLQALFRNKICQFLYAGIHPRWTFRFALHWSLNSRKKGISNRPAHCVQPADYLIKYAMKYLQIHPDICFFVFGHCHAMLDMNLTPETRLLVTGEWMTHFSYIQWDGNLLELKKF